MTDTPLSEITLRKYEEPYQGNRRELVKKVCLSLGLLQPGDSRDVIVDILSVLIEAGKSKQEMQLEQIKEKVLESRKKASLETKGVADSNIRRQLKRLRDLMIIEKISNNYRVTEFERLSKIFDQKIRDFFIPSIIERIHEYLEMLETLEDKA